MAHVRLSERMKALAAMVTPGSRLADVGCDHAYIPIELCRVGRIPSAIAMDVKPGPLEIAREHIAQSGLDDRITTRLSDGLKGLGEDEADTVMIAGMGGLLTSRILTDREIPSSVTELILQPQSEVPDVRKTIRRVGFHIVDEDMVCEDGKFYPMMKAHRGSEPERDAPVQEMEDAFGPILLEKQHPVLLKWAKKELDVTDHILAHLADEMKSAPEPASLQLRIQELEYKRDLLRKVGV